MEQKEFNQYRKDVLGAQRYMAENNKVTKIEIKKIEKSKCEIYNSRFDGYHCND